MGALNLVAFVAIVGIFRANFVSAESLSAPTEPCQVCAKKCYECYRYKRAECVLEQCKCEIYWKLKGRKLTEQECDSPRRKRCPGPLIPGVCPPFYVRNQCHKDSDCKDKNSHCCFSVCSNQCQTYGEDQRCSQLDLKKPGKCGKKCKSCKQNEICCNRPSCGGLVCVNQCPECTMKKCNCPNYPSARCIRDKCGCISHYELPTGLTLKPVDCLKAKICPPPLFKRPCRPEETHKCDAKNRCPRGQFCCFDGCVNICRKNTLPPEIQLCPTYNPNQICPAVAIKGCGEDNDCNGDSICCNVGCSRECIPRPRKCPKKKLVNCLVPPCDRAVCKAQPNAICRNDYCGGCNTEWFLNGKEVSCNDRTDLCPYGQDHLKCLADTSICKSNSDCPKKKVCCKMGCKNQCIKPLPPPRCTTPNIRPISCKQHPCMFASCPGRKGAVCRASCNGCKAEWFSDGLSTTCKLKKPKKGKCPVAPKDIVTICPVLCFGDHSCPGKKKCCKWGCAIQCMNPV